MFIHLRLVVQLSKQQMYTYREKNKCRMNSCSSKQKGQPNPSASVITPLTTSAIEICRNFNIKSQQKNTILVVNAKNIYLINKKNIKLSVLAYPVLQ